MDFSEILKNFDNLDGFERVNDNSFEYTFEISWQDAFDLSAIVGSSYLVTPTGVSMKGRNETFIHRSVFQEKTYIYSPGLFGRDLNHFVTAGNSSGNVYKNYPSIFVGKKKLVLIQIQKGESSNIEMKCYNKILAANENPKDYLLLKIFAKSALEPILEYFAYKYFIKKGYIFENQTPFFQQNFKYKNQTLNGGIPDISLFKTNHLNSFISRSICSNDLGILINRIPFLNLFYTDFKYNQQNHIRKIDYELIIGEAKDSKSSIKQAYIQMEKYKKVDLADYIFSFIPDYISEDVNDFGSLSIENGNVIENFGNKYLNLNQEFRNEDQNYIGTVLKLNLLANLDFIFLTEQIIKYFKLNEKGFFSFHLMKFAMDLHVEDIFRLMDEN